jgi:hypothetical protein
MSLEDLGNIGELIAAIGVIISLVYLAVQIRQNTQSMRAVAYQSISAHIAESNRVVVESPEIAHIMITGEEDLSALSGEERRRFTAHMSSRFRHWDNLYYQYRIGMLDESQWRGFRRLLRYQFQRNPGWVAIWRELSPVFTEEFVSYVESILTRIEEARKAGVDL